MCVGLKVWAHDPHFRQSAEACALLRATGFHSKYYKDLGETKFKSSIFHLSWAPLFSPQFSPKVQPKQFFGHHGTALQTATCLNVSLSVGDPDLTVVNVHQSCAPPGKSSNGELSAVRSVADSAWQQCVLKIHSTLFFDWATVCCCLYRLPKVSQAHRITASNHQRPIDDSLTVLNSFSRRPAVMPPECYNVSSWPFEASYQKLRLSEL